MKSRIDMARAWRETEQEQQAASLAGLNLDHDLIRIAIRRAAARDAAWSGFEKLARLLDAERTWPGTDGVDFTFPSRLPPLEKREPFLATRCEVASTRRRLVKL